MPFETGLNYSEFSVRVPEAQVEEIDAILRSVSQERRAAMRLAMRRLWTRFIYARSFLDSDTYLGGPPATGGRRVLPRDHLQESSLRGLGHAVEQGAPDALDTIMLELALRLEASHESRDRDADGKATCREGPITDLQKIRKLSVIGRLWPGASTVTIGHKSNF